MSFLISIFKNTNVHFSLSVDTYHKFAEIIASDSVMISLKCHTMVFASNYLFILPSELAGHTLAYAFV